MKFERDIRQKFLCRQEVLAYGGVWWRWSPPFSWENDGKRCEGNSRKCQKRNWISRWRIVSNVFIVELNVFACRIKELMGAVNAWHNCAPSVLPYVWGRGVWPEVVSKYLNERISVF